MEIAMFDWIRSRIDAHHVNREREREAERLILDKRTKSRLASHRRKQLGALKTLEQARAATAGTFVVGDLETTGLTGEDEILEIAALRANGAGTILREMSVLIRVRNGVPSSITQLTGITQRMVDAHGVSLPRALCQFIDFAAAHPVFFFNAGFDKRFIRASCARLAIPYEPEVLCALKVARARWPSLPSHTLEILARHTGAPRPTHRGSADVRATLHILREALREELNPA